MTNTNDKIKEFLKEISEYDICSNENIGSILGHDFDPIDILVDLAEQAKELLVEIQSDETNKKSERKIAT